jgi:hypothetical protein
MSKIPEAQSKISAWLARHDMNLERFEQPVPVSKLASETCQDEETIRAALLDGSEPIYHLWSHKHKGNTRPTKPYCLRLSGPESVGLDWENSVVGAAIAHFQELGYATEKEIGSEVHIQELEKHPMNLTKLESGVNLRDLWAVKELDENKFDFWIIEAKGKEAGGFERYCFAETLSQLFEVPGELMTDLFGAKKKTSHGLCYSFAQRLASSWEQLGVDVTVNLAVLIPLSSPDVVWSEGAKIRQQAYYRDPVERFEHFVTTGDSNIDNATTKGKLTFSKILDHLEEQFEIRQMASSEKRINFRLLAPSFEAGKHTFERPLRQ